MGGPIEWAWPAGVVIHRAQSGGEAPARECYEQDGGNAATSARSSGSLTTTACGSPAFSPPLPPPVSSPTWSYATAATPASQTAARTGKDTGLRNVPFRDLAQNWIWVAIAALAADLCAWTARLALPAHTASYKPNGDPPPPLLPPRTRSAGHRKRSEIIFAHHHARPRHMNNTPTGPIRDHGESRG